MLPLLLPQLEFVRVRHACSPQSGQLFVPLSSLLQAMIATLSDQVYLVSLPLLELILIK